MHALANLPTRKLTNLLIWLLALIAACSPSPPLPTRAVVATVPPRLTLTPTLPPTIPPQPTATVPPTPTSIPSLIPVPLPTPSPTPCAGTGRIETAKFPSQAGSIAYRIYLPPCYGENGRTYPTLYMLPGNNQTDAIWDTLGLDETAEAAIQNAAMPPFLIVMPDGGWIALNTSGGPASYETVITDNLIPFIEANYCAWPDPAGRALGGVSRGGYWALEIAFRHPEQFVSVGGHSASLLDIAAGPDLNPQYTGLTHDLGDLRIYLDIGANDGGMTNTRKLHNDLEAKNIPHTWVLNEGSHDAVYWSTHLADYLTWYAIPWNAMPNPLPLCP